MKIFGKQLPFLLVLFISLLLIFSVSPIDTIASDDAGACALTPDKVDGQGFRVSSLGFRVSSLGFRVSSLGFRVSSLGFRVSSLADIEAIIMEIVENQVTPAWLVDGLPDVITGAGYNSIPVYLLVVDDFSNPDAHGFKVRHTIDMLIDAVDDNDGASSPNIHVIPVDIAPVDNDASLIAGTIKDAVESVPNHENAHFVVNMSFGLVPCEDDTDVMLTDFESGEKFMVTENFSFDEYMEGPPPDRPTKPILPILECVQIIDEGEGHGWHHWKKKKIVAYFGYSNPNQFSVEIPIGSQNKFSPHPKDRGQPVEFAPGRHEFVFSVEYQHGSLVWKLGHKHAFAGPFAAYTKPCEGEIPDPPSQIIPQGYSLTEHFTESMNIPEKFVDEYFQYLFDAAEETEPDPFANIQLLMRMYQQRSHAHATDGDPYTNFALIPVASAGNFRYQFGGQPLKPAEYPEVIATSASVGDFGPLWVFSHDGNVIAPGVSVALAMDSGGEVTEIGAGTSHAAPFVTTLSALWLTYPNACNFDPAGKPPLVPDARPKDSNAIFTGDITPLDCHFNNPPVLHVDYEGGIIPPIDEGDTRVVGSVSDPDGDMVTLSTDTDGVMAILHEDNTWSIKADDGLHPPLPQVVEVTANDGRGGISKVILTLTVINVPPTAELTVWQPTVDVLESALIKLENPFDPSPVDTAHGFSYVFDCDTSDTYTNPPTASNAYSCNYSSEGIFPVTATIIDKDGGSTTYDTTITVVASEPKTCYAEYVESYEPGRRRGGWELKASHRNPDKALGAPQNNDSLNYVSLGFAHHDIPSGSLIVSFGDKSILNENGAEPDVRIWETSYRDHHRPWRWYPEAVDVYASIDGATWVHIGTTTDKDQAYDLGDLSHANYIKLVDVSNPWKFGWNADGFDVDAIEGFSCGMVDYPIGG